jgi:ketosteroid isomerase-like protein
MKSLIIQFFAFAFLISMLFAQEDSDPSVRTAQSEIAGAIEKAHDAIREAAEALDVEGLYDHVLDHLDGVIIEDGRVLWNKREAEENTRRGMGGIRRLSYSYVRKTLTELGPGLVLWVGEGTSQATLQDGREFSVPFAETVVFKAESGSWKVLHAHRSVPNR